MMAKGVTQRGLLEDTLRELAVDVRAVGGPLAPGSALTQEDLKHLQAELRCVIDRTLMQEMALERRIAKCEDRMAVLAHSLDAPSQELGLLTPLKADRPTVWEDRSSPYRSQLVRKPDLVPYSSRFRLKDHLVSIGVLGVMAIAMAWLLSPLTAVFGFTTTVLFSGSRCLMDQNRRLKRKLEERTWHDNQ